MENLPSWVKSAIGLILLLIFIYLFRGQLFSVEEGIFLMAWTLLATCTIPFLILHQTAKQNKIEEENAREHQKYLMQILTVQSLSKDASEDEARSDFREVAGWEDSQAKDKALRIIRTNPNIPLPGSPRGVENVDGLKQSDIQMYVDSFSDRYAKNPVSFINQSIYMFSKMDLLDPDIIPDYLEHYLDLIFNGEEKFSPLDESEFRSIFRRAPKISHFILGRALNSVELIDGKIIYLVVDSAVGYLFNDSGKDEVEDFKRGIAQPITNFLNCQSFRNISSLSIGSNFEILRTAVSIVFLASKSKYDDHLDKRMIENIDRLFRDIDIRGETLGDCISSDINGIKLDWRLALENFWEKNGKSGNILLAEYWPKISRINKEILDL